MAQGRDQEIKNSIILEIDNIDKDKNSEEILISISKGKSYLSNPKKKFNQSPQKDNTCWYYVGKLDPLFAPRYGKAFPAGHYGRKKEIAISVYRKNNTMFCEKLSDHNVWVENLNEEYPNQVIDKTKIQTILNNIMHFNDQEKENLMFDLGSKFLSQSKSNNFYEFAMDELCQEKMDYCYSLLRSLGYDPDYVLAETWFKTGKANPTTTKEFSSQTVDFILQNIDKIKMKPKKILAYTLSGGVLAKIYEALQYQPSLWKPADDINIFINTLRTQGSCIIQGNFGDNFYSQPAHPLKEVFGQREVLGWNANERKENNGISHLILVVGVKKVGEKAYVYYLDPNDGNLLNEKGKIYKISYERLTKSINNIISNLPYTEESASFLPAFAFHGNPGEYGNAYLNDYYQALHDFEKTGIAGSNEEQATSSAEQSLKEEALRNVANFRK